MLMPSLEEGIWLKLWRREFAAFENQARQDGLILRHWARKQAPKPAPPSDAPADGASTEEPNQEQRDNVYQFAKYNTQIDAPSYTTETYEAQLEDGDWTKEETDYLVSLVKDYAQKWAVIVDRYEYTPPAAEDGSPPEPKPRSMEDLKARYYTVSAKALAQETPVASMNGQQFSLYETLTKFNANHEMSRKALVESHLYRKEHEVHEETTLLAELQRIMINQQKLETERREIRERLDYPAASREAVTQYSTSQALSQLFQQLLAADRLRKDRRMEEFAGTAPSGPVSQHRDSIGGSLAAQQKRGARDSLPGASEPETRSRTLSPHSSARYFVTMHDRLSSGVSFASDKLSKPRIAKSTIQTERIASVLQYLKIPDIIPLPTQRVVEEFDKLMMKVNGLLELRKVSEKEDAEIKVREAEKGIKVQKDAKKNGQEVKTEDKELETEGGQASTGTEGAGRGHKRSASVMSTTSHQSSKRAKSTHVT